MVIRSRAGSVTSWSDTKSGPIPLLTCFVLAWKAPAMAIGGPAIGRPKNPRALAGRLRLAQPGLRSLGIDIVFSREGRAGTRTITMRWSVEHTAGTLSSTAA